MKTREIVVQMPDIVAMRRETQSAYAELGELKKRQWGQSGTPGASYDTMGRTSCEIEASHKKHRVLTDAYEARVTTEMAS